jgi:uncharacterized protein YbjT (DUF2867 family)
MLMNAIIFGPSGMVGSELLTLVLDDERFEEVVAVSRSPLAVESPKLRQVIHTDYEDYSAVRDYLKNADICFYCLGVYQGQVDKKMFWKITVDFLKSLLDELSKTNNSLTFCLFSAQGASPDERSLFRFGNAKGRAERLLTDSTIGKSYIFRPGFINPGRISAMSGISLRTLKFLYRFFPSTGIDSSDLAKTMIEVGISGGNQVVYENKEMRDLLP